MENGDAQDDAMDNMCKDVKTLNRHLNRLMDMKQARFGGLDIVFAGDFRQLPPAGPEPLHKERNLTEFKHAVNCFVELHGMHRFANDPAFGQVCKRFRDGVPTLEDFDMINQRLVSDQNPMPDNIRVACHTNKQREAINVATWGSRHAPLA